MRQHQHGKNVLTRESQQKLYSLESQLFGLLKKKLFFDFFNVGVSKSNRETKGHREFRGFQFSFVMSMGSQRVGTVITVELSLLSNNTPTTGHGTS